MKYGLYYFAVILKIVFDKKRMPYKIVIMKRMYETILRKHFAANRQIALLSGPRQVGKTTTSKETEKKIYLNWDNQEHRKIILSGYKSIINDEKLSAIPEKGTRIIFDEIHKYSKWKNYLKGFFDTYENQYDILITGSSRMNVYKRGSDSLMGRYFPYRMHPLTTGELIHKNKIPDEFFHNPKKIAPADFKNLIDFGGFPEPFIKAERRFYNRWRRLRTEQLFREDIRDFTSINEIGQLEVLAELLENRTGQLINYSSLSSDVQVSVNTIKHWIRALEELYFCFAIKPWHRNVPKTLLKQPKIYLWDWSVIKDTGTRNENFIAAHLLKSVNYWTDMGMGQFDLYFLRDKMKREVDFLITRDQDPWILIEVKSSVEGTISPALHYFAEIIKPEHAFQVDMSESYIDKNCFAVGKPVMVPAVTLLSQFI